MNILVTGSNGQLGREMRRAAAQSTDHYIFTDVEELDITRLDDIRALSAREQVEAIVNCAAYTNVDRAEDDEAAADRLNHRAVENLARVAKEREAVLIHVSTDYVFGGNQGNTPRTEEEPVNPTGVYGLTKLKGEQAILSIGCQHLIFRTAWLYSRHGNNFVKTMRRLTREKESLRVVFDQVGTPTFAGDLADLICHTLSQRLHLSHQGIYHFSNEGAISWYDFAQEICHLSGNRCDIQPCHSHEFPSKVVRPSYSVLDKTKLKNHFATTIPYWKESLCRCIQQLEEDENNAN
ncbi:MAG: dTDP-4-dehydrorhamnose reductase [Bacteroidales bacterium]|nr:dTDP-4-dehydrorhamnose reductase [Bacteroidales bacterium]